MKERGRPRLPQHEKKTHNITCRLNDEIYNWLEDRARRNGRSFSAELVSVIEPDHQNIKALVDAKLTKLFTAQGA